MPTRDLDKISWTLAGKSLKPYVSFSRNKIHLYLLGCKRQIKLLLPDYLTPRTMRRGYLGWGGSSQEFNKRLKVFGHHGGPIWATGTVFLYMSISKQVVNARTWPPTLTRLSHLYQVF